MKHEIKYVIRELTDDGLVKKTKNRYHDNLFPGSYESQEQALDEIILNNQNNNYGRPCDLVILPVVQSRVF